MLLGGFAIVAFAAVALTVRLGAQTGPEFALMVYLICFAEIVGIVLTLSVVRSIDSWVVLAAAFVIAAAVVGPWLPHVRRRLSVRSLLARSRETISEPVVAVLALAVAAALFYSAALGLLTPPNDWDAMTYHLARASFWIQQQAVAYVPETHVIRINVNPPNAEIAALFTMLLSRGDRYVGLVQYTALLATAVGTYGISRRIGFDRRSASFGALLLVTTPVVILQGSTALNDVVVTSFLVAATYFLLGETRREFGFGGLALALALGTKFTALVALPLVVFVALTGQPRRRRPSVAVALAAGIAAGSYWFVVNIEKAGSFDGGAGEALDQNADRNPLAILARWTRMLSNFADDMNVGRDILVYVVAATAFVLLAAFVERRRGRHDWLFGIALFAVACTPLVVGFAREALLFGHERVWIALGQPDLAHLDENRDAWQPSSVFSYYGPLGLLLLLVVIGLVGREVTRGRLRPVVLLLACSPLVFAALVAFALSYDPWRGRFFMYSMALAATTWGVTLRWRWLAWGLTSIAAGTLLLSFAHSMEKPAGIRLIDRREVSGVWAKSREDVQTRLRLDGTAEVAKFFAAEPLSGRVGLRLEEDDWVYPYFGRRLSREVSFVPVEANLDGFDWLVLRAGRTEQPGAGWALAFTSTDGWRVFRRSDA